VKQFKRKTINIRFLGQTSSEDDISPPSTNKRQRNNEINNKNDDNSRNFSIFSQNSFAKNKQKKPLLEI
jgi:hypothetical protein